MQMTCQACGMPFEAKRPDAQTCSATCRSGFTAALEADLRDDLAALFTEPGWSFVERLAAFSRAWHAQRQAA